MTKVHLKVQSELKLRNIKGFIERKVTPFGTGAKVNCPKEYLGKKAYLVIIKE